MRKEEIILFGDGKNIVLTITENKMINSYGNNQNPYL